MILEILLFGIPGFVWGFRRGRASFPPFVMMAAVASAYVLAVWMGMNQAAGMFAPPAVAMVSALVRTFAILAIAFVAGVWLKHKRVENRGG